MPDGNPLPAIVYNGRVFPDADSFQTMVEEMPPARYEVQVFDCHVLNPNYTAEGAEPNPVPSAKNMSIVLLVGGTITLGEPSDAEVRGFSESIVLIPNTKAAVTKGQGKKVKEWLIQSQIFRLVT